VDREVGIGDGPVGGWACTCPAFKLGTPTPEQAVAALARSATVEAERLDEARWLARSKGSPHTYVVAYDPDQPGGWCKHVARCASTFLPWLGEAAAGAATLIATVKEQGKEIRVWEKHAKKLKVPRP
jgi:hypothetical protein